MLPTFKNNLHFLKIIYRIQMVVFKGVNQWEEGQLQFVGKLGELFGQVPIRWAHNGQNIPLIYQATG